ncbi:MAG: hypothetical protein ACR2KS_10220 [Candidatus Eremiobacter antarcticus]|nr:hypothetical protein [Candidatus Eremiobacteraeota bacterium]MBC5808808.1 hypothetical protein [Candidatus Eremiobacteraeota bacterium]
MKLLLALLVALLIPAAALAEPTSNYGYGNNQQCNATYLGVGNGPSSTAVGNASGNNGECGWYTGGVSGVGTTTLITQTVTGSGSAQSVSVTSSAGAVVGQTMAVTATNPENVVITAVVDGTHVSGIFLNNHTLNTDHIVFNALTGVANNQMLGYMGTISAYSDLSQNPNLLTCWIGNDANKSPTCGSVNLQTGVATAGVKLTNATGNTGSNAHDAPSAFAAGYGYWIVPYFASQTPTDANANCIASGTGGGAGSAFKCPAFSFGNTLSGGVSNKDLTVTGSAHYYPAMCGISEMAGLKVGNYFMFGGQGQAAQGNLYGCNTGAATYVTGNITGPGTFTWDTAANSGVITQCDTLAQAVSNCANAATTLSALSQNDAYLNFKLTTDAAVAGSFIVTLNGTTCTFSQTMNGTTLTDLNSFISAFNGGTTTGTGCSTIQNTYRAILSAGSHNLCTASANCVGFQLKVGNPRSLSAPSGSCTGTGIVCVATNDSLANGGTFAHWQWGAPRYILGNWWYLLDSQMNTNSYDGVNAGGGNGYANLMYLVRSTGPVAGVWTWCASDNTNCFTASPSTLLANITNYRFGSGAGGSANANGLSDADEYSTDTVHAGVPYIVRPPVNGYATNQTPFRYDYADASNISPAPVRSGKDITLTADGTHAVIAFACDNSSGTTQVCFARIDLSNRQTDHTGFIESGFPSGAHTPSVAITTTPSGNIIALIATGEGSVWPNCGTKTGTCIIEYKSTDNGLTWAFDHKVVNYGDQQGGTGYGNIAGLCCNIWDTPDGMRVFITSKQGNEANGGTNIRSMDCGPGSPCFLK